MENEDFVNNVLSKCMPENVDATEKVKKMLNL